MKVCDVLGFFVTGCARFVEEQARSSGLPLVSSQKGAVCAEKCELDWC
jgi:hypothetical protein